MSIRNYKQLNFNIMKQTIFCESYNEAEETAENMGYNAIKSANGNSIIFVDNENELEVIIDTYDKFSLDDNGNLIVTIAPDVDWVQEKTVNFLLTAIDTTEPDFNLEFNLTKRYTVIVQGVVVNSCVYVSDLRVFNNGDLCLKIIDVSSINEMLIDMF